MIDFLLLVLCGMSGSALAKGKEDILLQRLGLIMHLEFSLPVVVVIAWISILLDKNYIITHRMIPIIYSHCVVALLCTACARIIT